MATFKLEYVLTGAGWARATIWNNNVSAQMTVSYLHNSLLDLANAAKALITDVNSIIVIFMDEPGEHQLVFERNNDSIFYEIRWFEDWASWNECPLDKYQVVLSGFTTLKLVVEEILNTLKYVYDTYGLKNYKERWIEHEFPIYEFNQLKLMRKTI